MSGSSSSAWKERSRADTRPRPCSFEVLSSEWKNPTRNTKRYLGYVFYRLGGRVHCPHICASVSFQVSRSDDFQGTVARRQPFRKQYANNDHADWIRYQPMVMQIGLDSSSPIHSISLGLRAFYILNSWSGQERFHHYVHMWVHVCPDKSRTDPAETNSSSCSQNLVLTSPMMVNIWNEQIIIATRPSGLTYLHINSSNQSQPQAMVNLIYYPLTKEYSLVSQHFQPW